MPNKYKKKIGSRNYRNYTTEMLEQAVDNVRKKKMTQREASKFFRIPRGTIQNKLANRFPNKPGHPTVLAKEEESRICEYILLCSKYGFPLDVQDLKQLVKHYLDKKGVAISYFEKNIPGRCWVDGFLERNPLVTQRFASNIKIKRAEVNSDVINKYFDQLTKELKDVPPSNIFNFDETNLTDDPGKKKVLCKRGCKYPERIINSSKQSTSVMFCGNAEGKMVAPYVVYKSKHLYDTWCEGGPAGTKYNRTVSGWFDLTTFEDWFKRQLLPQLTKLTGTKVVICDNLSTHISVHTFELCRQHNIKFICLPPNTTHLTQPLDVAYFAPMKKTWRKILSDFKLQNRGSGNTTVAKSQFPKLLKKLVESLKNEETLKNGFRKTGIYPLNRNEVLERLPIKDRIQDVSNVDKAVIDYLEKKRYGSNDMENVSAKKKKKLDVIPGKSVVDLDHDERTSEDEIDERPGLGSFTDDGFQEYIEYNDIDFEEEIGHNNEEPEEQTKNNEGPEEETENNEEPLEEETENNEESFVEETENIEEPPEEKTENDEETLGEKTENIEEPPEEKTNQERPEEECIIIINETNSNDYVIDDYVIFQYLENYYPGKIIDIVGEDYIIKAMVKCGVYSHFYKFPSKDDILSYTKDCIIKKINTPIFNARKLAVIHEMSEYEEFSFD